MNKGIVAFIICAFVLLFAVTTCPNRKSHADKLTEKVTSSFYDKIKEKSDSAESASVTVADFFVKELMGNGIVEMMSNYAVERMLTYDSYFLFSTGSIRYKGERHIVSIGLFKTVFVLVDTDELADKVKLDD